LPRFNRDSEDAVNPDAEFVNPGQRDALARGPFASRCPNLTRLGLNAT
jgi:hypothetical protein